MKFDPLQVQRAQNPNLMSAKSRLSSSSVSTWKTVSAVRKKDLPRRDSSDKSKKLREFKRNQAGILREFSTILDQQTDLTVKKLVDMKICLLDEKSDAEKMWRKLIKQVEVMKEEGENGMEEVEKEMEKVFDTASQILAIFNRKKRIEEFVRQHEGFALDSLRMAELAKENSNRIDKIQKLMSDYDSAPVALGQNDSRSEEVFHRLVAMIHQLPLDSNELAEMKMFINQIEKQDHSRVYKCELISRRLFAIMSAWNQQNTSVVSEDWKSVSLSSSFVLSDVNDLSDSNLNDLEGQLREAQIRTAIDGSERQVIQLESWSASDPDFLSSSGSELSVETCVEQSTKGKLVSDEVKTARSEEVPSLSYSNVTLLDMVEDVLHTAKEATETQAANLLDALKDSANKCGVAVSDLLTAVSGSSENSFQLSK